MAKRKPSTIKLQVFKGREAKLNKAIFHTLAQKSPQTIYNIHKEIKAQKGLRHTRYTSVNKRVRFLEESGYVQRIGAKKTKAGFEAFTYDLRTKAYLAILLNSINLENLLAKMEEITASEILAALIDAQDSGTDCRC